LPQPLSCRRVSRLKRSIVLLSRRKRPRACGELVSPGPRYHDGVGNPRDSRKSWTAPGPAESIGAPLVRSSAFTGKDRQKPPASLTMQSLAGKSQATPTLSQGIVVSWCGMRGLVTLAVALALPKQFPGHALIILSAFSVVIGTLIIQGLTLKPHDTPIVTTSAGSAVLEQRQGQKRGFGR
jgi:hypothetical protein